MASVDDFATWEPLLRLLRDAHAARLAAPGGFVAGRIDRHGWSVPLPRTSLEFGRAAQVEDMQDRHDAIERVRVALPDSGLDGIGFVLETGPAGRAVLHLLRFGPAATGGGDGPHPGALILVDGALPEPWRRLPDPVPTAVPSPSVDLALLERTLRQRLPGATGASEAEIAATRQRLGVQLPDELAVLYRMIRGGSADWGDEGADAQRDFPHLEPEVAVLARRVTAVGCELFPLDEVYVADAASRYWHWEHAATQAIVNPSDGAVQQLVGSPGWIVFGDNTGGDRFAVDLTPGPRGHVGQIIEIDHESSVGAGLIADSLTDLVLGRRPTPRSDSVVDEPRAVAQVNVRALPSVQAAAHPDLEVLCIGVWEGAPLSLAPVVGLPRLRTLTAYPGTLADPREVAALTGLEFLSLGPREWRILLDAGVVPRSLTAAAVTVHGEHHPLSIVAICNELLALWDRPPIVRTTLDGHLGPTPAAGV